MPLQLTTIAEASPEPPAKRVCTPATAATVAGDAAAALAAAPAAAPLQYVYCFETLGDKKVVVIGRTNNIEATLNRVNSSHAACGMQFRFRCAALTLNYERDAWLTRNYFISREKRGYFEVPYEAVWRFFEKVIKPMHKYESEYAHEASSTSEEGSEDESEDDSEESEESEESEDEAAVTS